jgi:hypothetical protein
VILSNYRLDGKPVPVRAMGAGERIETGLAKFGALIGGLLRNWLQYCAQSWHNLGSTERSFSTLKSAWHMARGFATSELIGFWLSKRCC